MAVCLLGTRWGQYLGSELRNFYRGPLYVCGRDIQRTTRIARQLGAEEPLFAWETAVEHPKVESVIVAAPPTLHRATSCAALRAGKHVLVEKPIATTLQDADAIIQAAYDHGRVLPAGENIPFRPAIRKAKELLAKIGQPRLFLGTALHTFPKP